MDVKGLLGISEFSRLSGIARKTLIFYDETGVFSPAVVGKNRYRYYSRSQLQVVNVLWALREVGVPLGEIRRFLDSRTPKRLIELCRRQGERVAAEMAKLRSIQEVIGSLETVTADAAREEPGVVGVRELPRARLFMGPVIDSGDMKALDDALSGFYELCAKNKVPPIHPLGSLTRLDAGLATATFRPYRFYCPAGEALSPSLITFRPRGSYAVCHAYGDYGKLDGLYRKILRFIKGRGLTGVGDAYEEYILNEIALRDPGKYLARVAVRVA